MSRFQLLSADIALGGDILNVVARHAGIPVTYPELLILRYVHGEGAVTNVFDVGWVEREDADERQRLKETYGEKARDKLFPGAASPLPLGDNRYRPRVKGTKINPDLAPPIPDLPAAPDPSDASQDSGTAAGDYTTAPAGAAPYAPVDPEPAPVPVPVPAPAPPPRLRRATPVAPLAAALPPALPAGTPLSDAFE